jgi:hypothetical protein
VFAEDEARKLAEKSIPVHAFHIGSESRLVASFSSIASITQGLCEQLDIDSSSGAERLTQVVTEQVLQQLGGEDLGDKLVLSYRSKFVKGYVATSSAALSAQ